MLAEITAVRKIGYDFFCRCSGCKTVDHNMSVCGDKKPVCKLDQRGFSASIGPQKAYDLSSVNRQVQIGKGEKAAVFFRQSLTFKNRSHCKPPFLIVSVIISRVSSSEKPSLRICLKKSRMCSCASSVRISLSMAVSSVIKRPLVRCE